MAERRINRISIAVFAVCCLFGGWMLARTMERPIAAAIGVAVIVAAHLVTVPAPSGEHMYLGIGAATALPFLVADYAALMAILTLGVAVAWALRVILKSPNLAGSYFLSEVAALMAFASAYIIISQATGSDESASNLAATQVPTLITVAAAGIVWFVVRALTRSLVGLEREDLSARYLWLLALEDWAAIVSLFTAGALFGLAFEPMGLWAIPLALLPYALSHLAFVRYHDTRVTYGQTIRALAQIPEVAGLATRGHSARTAEIAVSIARDIGMHPDEVTELEYAALMHDIGRITLNEPAILRAGYTDEDIARWGAQIIGEAPFLETVGLLVKDQHRPYRSVGEERDQSVPLASQIIKVASAYDQAIHDQMLSPLDALELLHLGTTYDYDPDVTSSLRRVISARGDLHPASAISSH